MGLELRGCAFLVASITVFLASPAVFGLVWESCWGLSGTLICPNLACGFLFCDEVFCLVSWRPWTECAPCCKCYLFIYSC